MYVFPVQNVSALKSPLHSDFATCAMNCSPLENGGASDEGGGDTDVEDEEDDDMGTEKAV